MCWSMVVYMGRGRGKGQGVSRTTCLIRFGAYNIWSGRNRGQESALRGIFQANMDLGVLQETKLTKRIYMRESSGYKMVAT